MCYAWARDCSTFKLDKSHSNCTTVSADYEVFFGAATPPTSYGGYGGNAEEEAKYTFEYPSGWKSSVPNKVEKGTQGIDCRVTNVRIGFLACFFETSTMSNEYCSRRVCSLVTRIRL